MRRDRVPLPLRLQRRQAQQAATRKGRAPRHDPLRDQERPSRGQRPPQVEQPLDRSALMARMKSRSVVLACVLAMLAASAIATASDGARQDEVRSKGGDVMPFAL